MATLRALLEIYGSLDTAVTNSLDPRVARIADQFLPGTSSNREWYRELESFMVPVPGSLLPDGSRVPRDVEGPRTDANPIRALQELDGDRHNDAIPPPTIPELSRMVYGLGAIIHLKNAVPSAPLPDLVDRSDENIENVNLLINVLALAGSSESLDSNTRVLYENFDAVVNIFANQFTGWQAWYTVTDLLSGLYVLSDALASVPLCLATVVKVKGIDAVVVDTEFSSSKVSLNDVKAVVDPRNWHLNLPSFFCATVGKGKRPDGWRRMLETVGFCYVPYSTRLRTMLKFYKSETNDAGAAIYEARVDYDLNDPGPGEGDGQITVDRGFIDMKAISTVTNTPADPAVPGVYVRTRKVAHINGLRSYTMARFVCIFGYAYGTIEMLFGSALNHDPNVWTPWIDPPGDDEPAPGSGPAKQPPAQSGHSAVSTVIKTIVECAEDLSVKNADLADKWLSGKLTLADLTTYSADVGARIASDPWKLLQAIAKPKGGGT
jgi:hypothetical protein